MTKEEKQYTYASKLLTEALCGLKTKKVGFVFHLNTIQGKQACQNEQVFKKNFQLNQLSRSQYFRLRSGDPKIPLEKYKTYIKWCLNNLPQIKGKY